MPRGPELPAAPLQGVWWPSAQADLGDQLTVVGHDAIGAVVAEGSMALLDPPDEEMAQPALIAFQSPHR